MKKPLHGVEASPSPNRWSLAEIYHHVLKQSPSPEAAKIAILKAAKTVIDEATRKYELTFFCRERHEYKVGSPAGSEPIVVQGCALPSLYSLSWESWEEEHSHAIGRDRETRSMFEFVDIYAHADDVSRLLPKKTDEQKQRRRAKPATVHDWHRIDGEIARRCIDPATRQVNVPKNERKLARDMFDWCQQQDMQEPAESAMREAVKAICAALRTF
jgi:hypothetical protein